MIDKIVTLILKVTLKTNKLNVIFEIFIINVE